MTILLTGSAGFIGSYLTEALLDKGHKVIGIDNFSKYGYVKKSFDTNKNYHLYKGDIKNVARMKKLARQSDYIVALGAKIGGISYFHEYAYDLLAENDRIIASTFDAAIDAFQRKKLKKIIVVSSSMVYESTTTFPTVEATLPKTYPPQSTYGFQKLSCEYYAKGAYEQYGLPYTIVRPFNCVGIGESRMKSGKEVKSGTVKLAMSHVIPDLVQKICKGQGPVHILGNGKQIRCYTYGKDIAEGIVKAIFSPKAENEDFNISTSETTTVLQLAKLIWRKVYPKKPFRYVLEKGYMYDVQKRIPDATKAKKLLDFEATTTLSDMLDIVIPWIQEQIIAGEI